MLAPATAPNDCGVLSVERVEGAAAFPRESASRKRANASLLSRPTPPDDAVAAEAPSPGFLGGGGGGFGFDAAVPTVSTVSYTHLRAHET